MRKEIIIPFPGTDKPSDATKRVEFIEKVRGKGVCIFLDETVLIVAGPLLESWGPRPVFLLVATGQLLATIPFAIVAFGNERVAPVAEA